MLAAVVVVDAWLILRPSPEVDQIGVARAYRQYADNPTDENLRSRTERVEAAMRKERQQGMLKLLGFVGVTFGGGFAIGFQSARYRGRRSDGS